VTLTGLQLEELKEHLETHTRNGGCGMDGCCAADLVEFLEELIA